MAKVVNLVTNAVPSGTSFPPVLFDGNYLAAGTTRTLTVGDNHAVILLDTAGGSAITLPAATGSGTKFTFVVTTITTASGAQVVSCVGTDLFVGVVLGARTDSGNAVLGFAANGSTDNTITLDHADNGGVNKGEYLVVEDIAAGLWYVTGILTATGGAFATPFSNV